MSRIRLGLPALVAVTLSCSPAVLTAPPGSTMVVTANPESIPAFGGVSIISAMVVEPAGTLVPDGTVVQFFTNLGAVDEQGKTNEGVARVKLVSDSRSGTATVRAFSGGAAVTSSTPTSEIARALAADGGGASGEVTVVIGSLLVKKLLISAIPGRIVRPATVSEIVASAFDESGNPLPHVPITFAAFENDAGDPAKFEVLDSAGAPVFTDNNGRAYDRLRTRYNPNGQVRYVRVTATTPTAVDAASVTVQIN
jgi:hypothetical protein